MRKPTSSAVDVTRDAISGEISGITFRPMAAANAEEAAPHASQEAARAFDDKEVAASLAQSAHRNDLGTRLKPRRAPIPAEIAAKARSLVAGRYRIVSLVGEGDFGAVYEAEHVASRARVALKLLTVLRELPSQRAAFTERLVRDARRLQRLSNEDHVARILDAGDDDAFGPYVVSELLYGDNLDHALAVHGTLEPRDACLIVYQACRGLAEAHAEGITHRGLKPSNVYLAHNPEVAPSTEAARVRLLDFGVAHLVRDVSAGSLLVSLVSPQYMAPEQAISPLQADARADIYALGAILYEMLVGTPLVPSYPNYERTVLHLTTLEPLRISEALPDIDPAIDHLVASMCAPLDARISSAREVTERLLRIFPDLAGPDASLPPPAASGTMRIRPSRRARASSAPALAREPAPLPPRTSDRALRIVVACLGAAVVLLAIAVVLRMVLP